MEHQPVSPGRITSTELRDLFAAGKPLVVLDVREQVERSFCKIALPASATDLHVPMGELSDRLEELRASVQSTPLVVYCHLGQRSWAVARWLAHRGIEGVLNLEGGIDAWSVEVDPCVPRY